MPLNFLHADPLEMVPAGNTEVDWVSVAPRRIRVLGAQAQELISEYRDEGYPTLTLVNTSSITNFSPAKAGLEVPGDMQEAIDELEALQDLVLARNGIEVWGKLIKFNYFREGAKFNYHHDGDYTYTTAVSLVGSALLTSKWPHVPLYPGRSFTAHSTSSLVPYSYAWHELDNCSEGRISLVVRSYYDPAGPPSVQGESTPI